MNSKCANTHISVTSLYQNVLIIFVNNKYTGNIITVGTENYTWRLDIVQNLCGLWQFFLPDFWAQNVSIPPD